MKITVKPTWEEIAADYERVRLAAVELAALQEEGDLLAATRKRLGTTDDQLEELMLRLARARERLAATRAFDRA